MVEKIDFKEDLKEVISLPWLKIWMAGFAMGLVLALASLIFALPSMLGDWILNSTNGGDAVAGEDPQLVAFGFVLTFLLISMMTSFALSGLILINGSKTVQFLLLWSLVLSGYVALMGIALNLVGIVVLSVFGALVEGEWGYLILAALCVYPAYLSVKASYYCIVRFSKVSNWVSKTVAKTGSTS